MRRGQLLDDSENKVLAEGLAFREETLKLDSPVLLPPLMPCRVACVDVVGLPLSFCCKLLSALFVQALTPTDEVSLLPF